MSAFFDIFVRRAMACVLASPGKRRKSKLTGQRFVPLAAAALSTVLIALQIASSAPADRGFCGDICPSLSHSNTLGGRFGQFGYSVAGLGTNNFLVGEPYADTEAIRGRVYLQTVGSTGATFMDNPLPLNGYFGFAMAAVDHSRFVVSAPTITTSGGRVYLGRVDMSGPGGTAGGAAPSWSGMITNPSPFTVDRFGYSVASVGSNWVVVGAPDYLDTGYPQSGRVYFFRNATTNAPLITTIPNPSPGVSNHFGNALAPVGADRFVVGVPDAPFGAVVRAGAVYLYGTNGTLLKTINNPNPKTNDQFGISVAELGQERFAVGAVGVDYASVTGTNQDSGAVYLYDKTGRLLRTIPNPFPAGSTMFGYSITRLGEDRFLVGAPQADGASGRAYLFNINGNLLATLLNPGHNVDRFGQSVAAVGSDWFVVGAPLWFDQQGHGSAYVYDARLKEYYLGQEIPMPPNFALADLVDSGPEVEPEDAAFWHRPSVYDGRLYATRAGQILIRWKTVRNETISIQALNVWPPDALPSATNRYQLHIANTPAVDLNDGGRFTWGQLMDTDEGTGVNPQEVRSRRFAGTGSGKSLLLLSTGNPREDPIYFQLVKTLTWDDLSHLHDNVSAVIGLEIRDSFNYHDPALGGPLVFWQTSLYCADPGYYDRARRTGPIIPVNRDQPTYTDDMVVVYYQKSRTLTDPADGTGINAAIAWPWKPVRYLAQWPTQNIADNFGTNIIANTTQKEVIDPLKYFAWDLYIQNDPTQPGFNPNDEHALILAGSQGPGIYPLRSDLGTSATSEPYLLMKYLDFEEFFRPKIKVFKVVAELAPYFFRYDLKAAQLVQPPFPLSVLPKCPQSYPVSGPYWTDRKGDVWAKAAGNDGVSTPNVIMRYFYPVQSGFYFPSTYFQYFSNNIPKTNLPPLGTCFPWLDLYGGVPKTPKNITYPISWPEAPQLHIYETLVKPKRGLPAIRGQTSAEILYQQAVANGAGESVQLIDPTAERIISLSGFEPDHLPPHVVEAGKWFFPNVAPQFRKRLYYDPTDSRLKLRGQFVEPELGESYLLLNVLTQREAELLKQARENDSVWQAIVGRLAAQAQNVSLVSGQTTYFDSLALTAGNAKGTGFVTVAFGNNPNLSPPAEPVSLAVIQVVCPIYQGEIKIVESENPFDEKLTLRHSGDFAGNSDNFYFQWEYYRAGQGPFFYTAGDGVVDITIQGPGLFTLADNSFRCRYRPKQSPFCPTCQQGFSDGGSCWTDPKLGEGWIKRVLKGIEPFEQRLKAYRDNRINTIVSMISQAGPRWEGAVPLSLAAADDFGLIEIYETVFQRGMDLSINANFAEQAANQALMLAAGRLAELYMLLGNEAYADATDPTIGFGTDDGQYGSQATSIHCFMNQTPSLIEEELALLRGRDDLRAPAVYTPPIYNRLAWNFTRDITGGEVAYALNYNIRDENGAVDGNITEADAKKLYPQGHGDAWGHYLTAIKNYYRLLRHPNFGWVVTNETVDVGGGDVDVSYFHERKFAAAAAAKARAGAEIVNLTYRQLYVDDPEGQWQGYLDGDQSKKLPRNNANQDRERRAWGLADWASRAGQGAFFDWVVANAILPETNAFSGIAKVQRSTVTDLREIPAAFLDIQSKADMADLGLNPLGLAKNVVPFDIDPSEVDANRTHYEQIHARAVQALNNAATVFDFANNSTQLLRRQSDDLAQFQVTVQEREADFNHRLIEVFGYPYSDDIGPAGTYPTGYDGPDLYHYAYADRTELMNGNPLPVQTLPLRVREIDVAGDGTLTTSSERTVLFHFAADGLGLVKPQTWTGRRRGPGEIQLARSDILQAHARFQKALHEYDNLLEQIKDQAELLEVQHSVRSQEIVIFNTASNTQSTLNDHILQARSSQNELRTVGRLATYLYDAIAEALPQSVGLSFDAFSVGRSALKLVGALNAEIANVGADFQAAFELEEQNLKEMAGFLQNLSLATLRNDQAISNQLKQIEQLVRQEIAVRLEIYTLHESLLQSAGRYQGVLARGERLLEDRLRFRQQTAAKIQAYRYKDMAFRIFRNDALQKYRAQFDLAAMYACLAAKAYDYETCLLDDDPLAGVYSVTDIVRSRSIGRIVAGQPQFSMGHGDPGLADVLAWLDFYWSLLDGRLGFNNPQTETGRFSLRYELFRILPGATNNPLWRETLSRHVVSNVLDLYEFKRYCIPFYPQESVEPAIVIPFSTTINFGHNFFGWPAGGGDNDYDSTHFATKIRSVGVWFANYNNLVGSGMVNTPRVYLIPVGTDILRSPTGFLGSTREFNILDQLLPIPVELTGQSVPTFDEANPNRVWLPVNDSLIGQFSEIRKFARFRAYHDSGQFNENELTDDSRLIGRSVWNTRWLLIIPAGTLHSDRTEGLARFIYGPLVNGQRTGSGVSDIKIFFQTYAYSGN